MVALIDCIYCNNDANNTTELVKLTSNGFTLLHDFQWNGEYGSHIWDSIIQLTDGRIFHVECYENFGSWCQEDSIELALRKVSSYVKEYEIVPTK